MPTETQSICCQEKWWTIVFLWQQQHTIASALLSMNHLDLLLYEQHLSFIMFRAID